VSRRWKCESRSRSGRSVLPQEKGPGSSRQRSHRQRSSRPVSIRPVRNLSSGSDRSRSGGENRTISTTECGLSARSSGPIPRTVRESEGSSEEIKGGPSPTISRTEGLLASGSSSPCAFPRHFVVAFQTHAWSCRGCPRLQRRHRGGFSPHFRSGLPRINPVTALDTEPFTTVQGPTVEIRQIQADNVAWPNHHPDPDLPTAR